jgi:hypothetical protein
MLTFWDDSDAIKLFAGNDYSLAKYYDFDSDYLIEMEARVRHTLPTLYQLPCSRRAGSYPVSAAGLVL